MNTETILVEPPCVDSEVVFDRTQITFSVLPEPLSDRLRFVKEICVQAIAGLDLLDAFFANKEPQNEST